MAPAVPAIGAKLKTLQLGSCSSVGNAFAKECVVRWLKPPGSFPALEQLEFTWWWDISRPSFDQLMALLAQGVAPRLRRLALWTEHSNWKTDADFGAGFDRFAAVLEARRALAARA